MEGKKLTMREAILDPKVTSITWELVPGRGAAGKTIDEVLECAEHAAKDPRIHGVTLTDNPSGKPAMLPYNLALEIKNIGIDPLIHFTCKDKNRNSIQSDLYAFERSGLEYLLVMTGDYQTDGYKGQAQKVFDIDPVHTVKLISDMNKGERVGKTAYPPTHFFPGVVVSPFKRTEAEQVTQYYKLIKKIKAGAEFVITQVGYDPVKFEELKIFMDTNDIRVPLIGNVYMLSYPVAKMMYGNKLPGCVVSETMLRHVDEERGRFSRPRDAQLLRSAEMYAMMKGLKYDGINIGGHGMKYEDFCFIMEKGEELSKNWQEIAEKYQAMHNDGTFFYYYEKKEDSIWNSEKPVDLDRTGEKRTYLDYKLMHLLHVLVLSKHAPFYKPARWAMKMLDDSPLKGLYTKVEHLAKVLTNDCKQCGDCAMPERSFLCPMSVCPKQQRNGPCGGSYNGWCEVYPDKQKCIYVMAYDRLKSAGDKEKLQRDYIPPYDASLYKTASEINFFCGRDFMSRKEYIEDINKVDHL